MADSNYKWRYQVRVLGEGDNTSYEADLICLKSVPNDYLHRPGDVDYSEIVLLPPHIKTQILYHVAIGADYDGLNSAATHIAGCILVDRLTMPRFLPEVLNPYTWLW